MRNHSYQLQAQSLVALQSLFLISTCGLEITATTSASALCKRCAHKKRACPAQILNELALCWQSISERTSAQCPTACAETDPVFWARTMANLAAAAALGRHHFQRYFTIYFCGFRFVKYPRNSCAFSPYTIFKLWLLPQHKP